MTEQSIPPSALIPANNAMDDMLIVTPELRNWAGQAVEALRSQGHYLPADLVLLRDGCTVSRFRWLWLVDAVRAPRPACPF